MSLCHTVSGSMQVSACLCVINLSCFLLVWNVSLFQALSGIGETLQVRAKITENTALEAALNTQFLFQIGIFTAVPMVLGFILEHGFLRVSSACLTTITFTFCISNLLVEFFPLFFVSVINSPIFSLFQSSLWTLCWRPTSCFQLTFAATYNFGVYFLEI